MNKKAIRILNVIAGLNEEVTNQQKQKLKLSLDIVLNLSL